MANSPREHFDDFFSHALAREPSQIDKFHKQYELARDSAVLLAPLPPMILEHKLKRTLPGTHIAEQARQHGIHEADVVRDVLLTRTPIKRLIELEEVGNLVAVLCGPGTDSITGASYTADGGWSAT